MRTRPDPRCCASPRPACAQNNKLNDTLSALTNLSMLILPAQFFCGVYGMNFDVSVLSCLVPCSLAFVLVESLLALPWSALVCFPCRWRVGSNRLAAVPPHPMCPCVA